MKIYKESEGKVPRILDFWVYWRWAIPALLK